MKSLAGEEFLLCLAQVGLGVAAFYGLIATLRQERGARCTAREIAGTKLLLKHSCALVLLSLLPISLHFLLSRFFGEDYQERWTWQAASLLFCAFVVWDACVQLLTIARLRKQKDPPSHLRALVVGYFVTGLVVLPLSLYNGYLGTIGFYTVSMMWLLLQAGGQFWVFLLNHTKEAPDTGEKEQR